MFLMKLTSFSFQPPLTQVKKMRPLKGPPWQGRELVLGMGLASPAPGQCHHHRVYIWSQRAGSRPSVGTPAWREVENRGRDSVRVAQVCSRLLGGSRAALGFPWAWGCRRAWGKAWLHNERGEVGKRWGKGWCPLPQWLGNALALQRELVICFRCF